MILVLMSRRGRYQQSCEIHSLAIHTNEQGEVECVPAFDAGDGYFECEWACLILGSTRPCFFLVPVHLAAKQRLSVDLTRISLSDNVICTSRISANPQIRLVFAAVKETILQNALRDSGIL